MRGEKPAEHDGTRTILEDWPWVELSYTFTIPTPKSGIKSVSIDPSERLADVNDTNDYVMFLVPQD
jgi:hypothetical protein